MIRFIWHRIAFKLVTQLMVFNLGLQEVINKESCQQTLITLWKTADNF